MADTVFSQGTGSEENADLHIAEAAGSASPTLLTLKRSLLTILAVGN